MNIGAVNASATNSTTQFKKRKRSARYLDSDMEVFESDAQTHMANADTVHTTAPMQESTGHSKQPNGVEASVSNDSNGPGGEMIMPTTTAPRLGEIGSRNLTPQRFDEGQMHAEAENLFTSIRK